MNEIAVDKGRLNNNTTKHKNAKKEVKKDLVEHASKSLWQMHLRERRRMGGNNNNNKRNLEYPNEGIIIRKTCSDVFGYV